MKNEIEVQRSFWNSEADAFERIYSHEKSKLSTALDRFFRKDMYERFAFTIANCKPIEGRRFLDVGCGNGLYSVELGKKGAARVVGLDISPVMIGRCRQSAQREALGDCLSFIQTDLLEYEPDSSFDVSYGIGLFDYISEPLPVVRKMREVTREKAATSPLRTSTKRQPSSTANRRDRRCSSGRRRPARASEASASLCSRPFAIAIVSSIKATPPPSNRS